MAAENKKEVSADGNKAPYTKDSVETKAAASDAKASLEIGDLMKDGTIYAGISPTTNQPMYAAPKDGPMMMDFNAASKFAKQLEVGDKKDFRLPDRAELNVLFKNKDKGALKGTFNLTGKYPSGYYWSSMPDYAHGTYDQRFSDGARFSGGRVGIASFRCIR